MVWGEEWDGTNMYRDRECGIGHTKFLNIWTDQGAVWDGERGGPSESCFIMRAYWRHLAITVKGLCVI